ncbi:MAG: DUF2272 domain-containing protein [Burkholderiaceae bacterium]|nr:DUF2272 domain-containing protein [Burkholderiaceae bacterium]
MNDRPAPDARRALRRCARGFALLALAIALGGCALSPREAQSRIDRLVAAALDEWRDWGRQQVRFDADGGLCAVLPDGSCRSVDDGCGRERSSRHCALVNRYWPGVSRYRHPCERTDLCEATLPASARTERTEPWSAAFVSHLYRRAGFSVLEFLFSDTHADYVLATREGRMPLFELLAVPVAPSRGDLLCAVRGPGKAIGPPMIDWISAQWSARAFTPMHCDLVVEVSRERGVARIVGGNVEQAVSMREAPLGSAGRLDWAPPPAPGWLLVLRLRERRSDFGEMAR